MPRRRSPSSARAACPRTPAPVCPGIGHAAAAVASSKCSPLLGVAGPFPSIPLPHTQPPPSTSNHSTVRLSACLAAGQRPRRQLRRALAHHPRRSRGRDPVARPPVRSLRTRHLDLQARIPLCLVDFEVSTL